MMLDSDLAHPPAHENGLPTPISGDPALEGVTLLADGKFLEALIPLRLAVGRADAAPWTVLNLAICEDRTGNRPHARALMQRVAEELPDWDEPVLRLAESLRAADQLVGAEAAYRRVLTLNPDRRSALIALSGLLLARNETAEAADLLRHCCGVAPDNPEAFATLGLALRETGKPSLARAAYVKAQRLKRNDLAWTLACAEAAIEAGEAESELARLEIECDNDPLSAVLQAGRGMVLGHLGRRGEAIDALEIASILAPDSVHILSRFADLIVHSPRTGQAEDVLRRLCAKQPDNPKFQNDHAAILMRIFRHEEARSILLELIKRHGPDTTVSCNLANATTCVGLQDEAVATARAAISFDPGAVLPRRTLCNTLPYQHGSTGAELLSALRDCDAVLARTKHPPFANTANPDRKLVVGLLSGTLRSHPVGWLTIAGIETLDPQEFSVVCLVQNATPNDHIARRFRAVAREWIEVDGMSDAALIAAAQAQEVDILIDLGGYGDGARMIACASRMAPVQIKWVGMQTHSSGLAEMDWFLTDRWETPPGFEQFYSERLLRLRDGYVCYTSPTNAPDVLPLPAMTNGYVTYGCFNNVAKITPQVITTWCTILHRVPNARLVLKTHQLSDPITAGRMLAAFTARGIDETRIELRGSSGHREFLRQYSDIDIVLDPFPYSGGLTTCEALWMGVPTITLAGEIFASRHSTSHLSNAGLPDWVTGSMDDYVTMAVARAANIPALAALRAELRDRVRRSPLCDAPRFGRNLSAALRHAWQVWCTEQQPDPPVSQPDAGRR